MTDKTTGDGDKCECCFKISAFEEHGYIEVYGAGNMNIAPVLKDICYAMINENKSTIFINLRYCRIVDSTFMGTLVNIHERFRKVGNPDGRLMLMNLNADHERLFDMVGISTLLPIMHEAIDVPDFKLKTIDICDVDREEKLRVVVEAHEKLVQLNEVNKDNFEKFLNIVKQEMHEDGIRPRTGSTEEDGAKKAAADDLTGQEKKA